MSSIDAWDAYSRARQRMTSVLAELGDVDQAAFRGILRGQPNTSKSLRVSQQFMYEFSSPELRAQEVDWILGGAIDEAPGVNVSYLWSTLGMMEPCVVRQGLRRMVSSLVAAGLEPDDIGRSIDLLRVFGEMELVRVILNELYASGDEESMDSAVSIAEHVGLEVPGEKISLPSSESPDKVPGYHGSPYRDLEKERIFELLTECVDGISGAVDAVVEAGVADVFSAAFSAGAECADLVALAIDAYPDMKFERIIDLTGDDFFSCFLPEFCDVAKKNGKAASIVFRGIPRALRQRGRGELAWKVEQDGAASVGVHDNMGWLRVPRTGCDSPSADAR